MSDWCPTCECLTVETYDQTCAFCSGRVERLDPFALASSTYHAALTVSQVSNAIDWKDVTSVSS